MDVGASEAALKRPAESIPVRLLRQTLLWPLALDLPARPSDNPAEFVKALRDEMAGIAAEFEPWKRIVDPLNHWPINTENQKREAYA